MELFLKYAAECEEMARFTRELESKATWQRMADRWRRCADVLAREDAARWRRMAERWRRCAEVFARESAVSRVRAYERRKHAVAA